VGEGSESEVPVLRSFDAFSIAPTLQVPGPGLVMAGRNQGPAKSDLVCLWWVFPIVAGPRLTCFVVKLQALFNSPGHNDVTHRVSNERRIYIRSTSWHV
jgi:hypothetical protein